MSYYHYKAEDFAADDDFKKWVCTPDSLSEKFWKEFLAENPEKYYAVMEGRRLVAGLGRLPGHAGAAKRAEKVWERIESTVHRSERPSIMRLLTLRVAAGILLTLGLGWWWQSGAFREGREGNDPFEEKRLSRDWEEVVNSTSASIQLRLSDGSLVVLEKNSQLRYENEFNDSLRILYLKGAAFFDVKKDPGRPFMVHANGLVTKVLGTSFSIQARESDPNVTVSVKTGRVSVYSEKAAVQIDPEEGGVVLTPNQKAIFERSRETLSKTLVEKPELLHSHVPASFAFESAPAKEVFEALAKHYGIEVLYDEELLKDCSLTIDLTREDLFQKLEVICKVLDIRYKLIETQVIIYGNGCS
ncbi:MAG: hypothetical protein ABS46_02565 [Cytophagaceae bacterium SCN 52-12]|mgnify:CR=1 FL=1|nr:MAG: hypothetical protein ABS46_02565 [Cytophagaceae bacterium SCN 52-12]